MSEVLGMNAKLYRNTGSYGTPVWNEIPNVRDLTLNLETSEADATTRANAGWEATVTALKRGSIDFEMVWDTADDDFTAIKDAYFNNTSIDIAAMDGDIAVSGKQGLRAVFAVSGFSRQEPLVDVLKVNVTIKPTYSANPPIWYTVP